MPSLFGPDGGTAPAAFSGRAELLAEVDDLLDRAAHFGTTSGPVVWTGESGVGKTTLLIAVGAAAQERGFVSAHLTADGATGLANRLAAAIAEAVIATGIDRQGRAWQRLAQRLAALDVAVSDAGEAAVEPSDDVPPTPEVLQSLIADAAILAIGLSRTGLVLAIDDLHEAPAAELLVLVTALEALTAGSSPVVTVIAGLPVLSEHVKAAGSFAGRYAYRSLGRPD